MEHYYKTKKIVKSYKDHFLARNIEVESEMKKSADDWNRLYRINQDLIKSLELAEEFSHFVETYKRERDDNEMLLRRAEEDNEELQREMAFLRSMLSGNNQMNNFGSCSVSINPFEVENVTGDIIEENDAYYGELKLNYDYQMKDKGYFNYMVKQDSFNNKFRSSAESLKKDVNYDDKVETKEFGNFVGNYEKGNRIDTKLESRIGEIKQRTVKHKKTVSQSEDYFNEYEGSNHEETINEGKIKRSIELASVLNRIEEVSLEESKEDRWVLIEDAANKNMETRKKLQEYYGKSLFKDLASKMVDSQTLNEMYRIVLTAVNEN